MGFMSNIKKRMKEIIWNSVKTPHLLIYPLVISMVNLYSLTDSKYNLLKTKRLNHPDLK